MDHDRSGKFGTVGFGTGSPMLPLDKAPCQEDPRRVDYNQSPVDEIVKELGYCLEDWEKRNVNDPIYGDVTGLCIQEAIKRLQWQPIETAPKTGIQILLKTKDGTIQISWWNESTQRWSYGGGSWGDNVVLWKYIE